MTFYRFSQWTAWALASFFYAYQYVLRVLPNILMPDIMNKFQIDAAAFGQFSGFYYIGYAGAHIPLGILFDRVGPKIIMPLCIVMTTLGLMPLIYTDLWIYPCLGRILIGVGSSGAILGVFKIIRMNFPESHFTRMLGISVMIGLLGAIYGGWPVNVLLDHLGCTKVLFCLMVIGLGLGGLFFLMIPRLALEKEVISRNILGDIKAVLGNKKLLLVCVLGGFMVGPLEGFADVWGTTFLKCVYGFDQSLASGLPSIIFSGMLIGSPLLSYVADKTKSYYFIIILSALGMGSSFVFILSGLGDVRSLSILFWIVGVLCAYQILVIYKASSFVNSHLTGLSTAVANMIIMIFGYVFHTLIGKSLSLFGGSTLSGDIYSYGKESFIMSLSFIPAGLFLGGLGFIMFVLFEKKGAQKHV